jgi:hypothetical protein
MAEPIRDGDGEKRNMTASMKRENGGYWRADKNTSG